MRPADPSVLLALLLASTGLGCAAPRDGALAAATPQPAAPEAHRGAELYGRYCTGCHAGAVGTSLARNGAPWLMHIQARVGMATVSSPVSETLAREDTRLIVDYLDASRPARRDD